MSTDVGVVSEEAPLDLRLSEDELEAHREHIVSFLTDLVESAGADGAVIGLSGGIDSTLTAHLAVEALGPERVHGLVMPSDVNTEGNMTDAERVAELLDVSYDVIDINPIVDAFVDAFPAEDTETRLDGDLQMAAGNVRVRTRGVLNYFLANAQNRIVLGTGNRSEALAGYYTKYGDQAVDCNPIGNLYKQQVRQLAAHVGVPEDLVTKTPSAEMWLGQTDEEEMGLTYDTLDAILAVHVDGPLSKSATIRELGVTGAQVDRVVELYERSEHKRHMPPAPAELDV
ncbi:NAD+ synthase [Salinirubrum litoreum]|uniref:NH(3)-dependent NAD(+) synthetase n=1 Tax=Salinirubrum litoreum TaxID=1126234 RepID=A0ABD5RDD2_9EURY|nr:NAD+ synthase [Salinirubrum litoreum]